MKYICILAGGNGNRFGSPVPKQYHLINGRPVIDYVIEAAIKSSADDIIVVSDIDRVNDIRERYGVISINGGNNRNKSIKNALDFLDQNTSCDKVILVDAVCPLVKSELFDLYFDYLDRYDAVFTTAELTTGLAKKDGTPTHRSEYFMIQSPDAYRFEIIKEYFDVDSDFTTPVHMLPKNINIKYYYGFNDYLKIVFPHDIIIAEALIREREKRLRFNAHSEEAVVALLSKLRKLDRENTKLWEKHIDTDIEELFSKWEVFEFTVNRDAYTGLVFDCKSRKHGNVILKIYPPFLKNRYVKESYVLEHLSSYPQVKLIDRNDSKCAMLLERIIPGDYISYQYDREEIKQLFANMKNNRVQIESSDGPEEIMGVVEQTRNEFLTASEYNYHPEMLSYLMDQAEKTYNINFADCKKYLLHGDAYFKNALHGTDEIKVIDPVGYRDAFIFEYMPFLTYELFAHTTKDEYLAKYYELIEFFSWFTDVDLFPKAVFVFLVKQLVPSIYEANDNFKRADTYLEIIKTLYIDEDGRIDFNK